MPPTPAATELRTPAAIPKSHTDKLDKGYVIWAVSNLTDELETKELEKLQVDNVAFINDVP
jgi:hypothetical protein